MMSKPLAGVSVVVTRPERQAGELVHALSAAGADVIREPLIRTSVTDAGPLAELDAQERVDLVILTSVNGVRAWREHRSRRPEPAWLATVRTAVVGPATRAACDDAGIPPDVVAAPGAETSEGLLSALRSVGGAGTQPGDHAALVRATTGSMALIDGLRADGVRVTDVPVYQTTPIRLNPAGRAAVAAADIVICMSGSTIATLAEQCPAAECSGVLVSIGPATSRTARAHGYEVAAEAAEATIPGILAAVIAAAGDVRGTRVR